MTRSAGFTLIEVLVALTILAVALGAVTHTGAGYARNEALLRDRTYAMWIARNKLVEMQLSDEWPSIGDDKGEVEFPIGTSEAGGREWRWVMQVSETGEANLRRLDIEVFPLNALDDSPAARLSGFLIKP